MKTLLITGKLTYIHIWTRNQQIKGCDSELDLDLEDEDEDEIKSIDICFDSEFLKNNIANLITLQGKEITVECEQHGKYTSPLFKAVRLVFEK